MIYCGPVIGSSSLFHVSFSRTPYRLFHVSQVDFTNAAAVKWYQEQLQGAVDLGFYGWMYDYGEYTPPDSISSDGTVGRRDWAHTSNQLFLIIKFCVQQVERGYNCYAW